MGPPAPASSNKSPTSPVFDSSSLSLGAKLPSPTATAPAVQKLPAVSPPTGLVFAFVATDATGKQTTKKIQDPATILDGDIHVVRVYLSLENLPPSPLHDILLNFQNQGQNPLQEIHLCVRSLLRPCLQDIYENSELEEAMLFMVDQWFAFGTAVKFFFHRPGVDTARDRFQNFVEKDLVRAVQGLAEGDVELSEILGEESCVLGMGAVAGGAVRKPVVAEYGVYDEMI
ncbi:hypothetical protein J4E90_004757 [Alternaria incomplexa]|uniref:uncharacterized protein n=1 Tax=Alternaria incomplexa TaxID=1187928 RepID=UPI00221EEA99|nr:uncharacterized protein J4E90_004757 [Alternaria incomplexa]XP_051301502.1 uncharacterized protein J4E86_006489 [Alternaria arbusti]KAI4914725.1 hypothetical protein J4E90_004757 [Alternaria incomplexa]KAI4952952.1 hypothetical protein J4E86_006489 [Alternaria arbusti]